MRRKYQKMLKYVILTGIFFGLVASQFVFLYAFEKRELLSAEIHYTDPYTSEIKKYDKKYTMVTPTSYTGRLPVIVMLHGDIVDQKSLNLLKSQFVRNGYMVVLFGIDFSYKSFLEIDAIVTQLLLHPKVEHTQIAIMGHSHGGHFAFWYGKLRSDVIGSVIMANMGSVRQLFRDYYEYYNYFVNTSYDVSLTNYLQSFPDTVTENDPKNLLIITDRYEPIRTTEANTANVMAWEANFQENVFIGEFSNGTARELNTKYKMFIHGSGLYNPNSISKQIDWINHSFGIATASNPTLSITLRIYGFFTLFVAILTFGVVLMYLCLKSIPIQLSWIKNRIFSKTMKRTKEVEIEIPPVLSFPDLSQVKQDVFRLEKRYENEFNYMHDVAEYFRIIVLGVIGIQLVLYFLELIMGENVLFFSGGISHTLSVIYALNDALTKVTFTDALSFNVMYFWILGVFFIRRLRIQDPKVKKPKMNILDIPNVFILGLEIVLIFWLFGFTIFYHWLGFDFLYSGLNVLLRYAVIFYLHFVLVEFIYNQASKPDSFNRRVIITAILFVLLIYLPVTTPSLSVALQVYKYALYYILPYAIVVGALIIFSILRKGDVFALSIFIFFVLLFWKFNVYYLLLF